LLGTLKKTFKLGGYIMKKNRKVIFTVIFIVVALVISITTLVQADIHIKKNVPNSAKVSDNITSTPISTEEIMPEETLSEPEDVLEVEESEDSEQTLEIEDSISNQEDITSNTEVTDNTEETSDVDDTEPEIPTTSIYLTFDDGPSTEITPQILDILNEYGVKATFFILDYDYGSEKEELVKREIDEGHTVALHGTSHDYSLIYSSLDSLMSNFTTLQEKVFTSTGYLATFIRFPGGSSNTVSKKYTQGIMTQAVDYVDNQTNFIYFDWNVDSDDAGSAKSKETIYNNVVEGLIIGHTNVVLMHDASSKIYTLEALPSIIEYCLENGYTLSPITSETPQITHPVFN
jgi:peptidoglycan/xylan/chitin deacetylase (PgdA/CDA1 family)